jgi:hypothetical protein
LLGPGYFVRKGIGCCLRGLAAVVHSCYLRYGFLGWKRTIDSPAAVVFGTGRNACP